MRRNFEQHDPTRITYIAVRTEAFSASGFDIQRLYWSRGELTDESRELARTCAYALCIDSKVNSQTFDNARDFILNAELTPIQVADYLMNH